jgi:hypothetical protein
MRGLRVVQMAAGLALLLVLFGSTFSQARAGDGPFITIHNRLCPAGYAGDDVYGDCHDTPQAAGVEFTISGPVNQSATTDGSGNVTFADLPTGTYAITGGAAGANTSTVIYCSFENEPETLVSFDPAVGAGVNFPAEGPSNGYICDWYHIPAAGSNPDVDEPTDNGWYTLTIHNRICPVGYTGTSFYEDCHDNPQTSNLEFNLIVDGDIGVAHGTTDDAGNVTFTDLPPDTYVMHGGVPGEFVDAVVYCSIEGIDGSGQLAPETEFGGFVLATNPNALGWHYICDWYNIPIDLSGGESTPTPTPVAGDDGDDDEDEEVTDLPNTGTGSVADTNTNIALYGLGLGFLALGVTAIAIRRRAMGYSTIR